MKVEHREAIERAKLHGIPSMSFAHEQEVIDRITKQAEEVVWTAVGIISSRSVCTIPFKVADSKFKEKSITVTGVVDAQDPNRAGLIDLSGKLALLVLAPNDYADGLDGIKAERDQGELPLSASEIIAGAGIDRRQEQQLELAEQQQQQNPQDDSDVVDAEWKGKEFGDFTYDDAKQLIVLKADANRFESAWVQSRLAIGTDQVTSLLLRLLDDGIIEVVDEGQTALEHGYKVVATLEQVV